MSPAILLWLASAAGSVEPGCGTEWMRLSSGLWSKWDLTAEVFADRVVCSRGYDDEPGVWEERAFLRVQESGADWESVAEQLAAGVTGAWAQYPNDSHAVLIEARFEILPGDAQAAERGRGHARRVLEDLNRRTTGRRPLFATITAFERSFREPLRIAKGVLPRTPVPQLDYGTLRFLVHVADPRLIESSTDFELPLPDRTLLDALSELATSWRPAPGEEHPELCSTVFNGATLSGCVGGTPHVVRSRAGAGMDRALGIRSETLCRLPVTVTADRRLILLQDARKPIRMWLGGVGGWTVLTD